jgi:hypothetical protein
MARRKLTVRRKGYRRKAYSYYKPSIDKTVHVKAATVKPATFKIEDVGAPGRGERVIPIRGKLDGYSTSMPTKERRDLLSRLVARDGMARVWRRLHAMVIMRKRTKGPAYEVFKADRDWVAETYGTEALTPRAAIRKWKRMSPRARALAMPGGRI